MGDEASRVVDAPLTRRLVALETADIDVPPPPEVAFAPLYFRVLSESPGSVRVELWELGRLHGFRRISTAGTEQLKARRIALAAAELSRQLRRRRLSEIAAARAPKPDDQGTTRGVDGFPIAGRLFWGAGARGAVPSSGGVLVGPFIRGALRFDTRQWVGLDAAWLAGDLPDFGGAGARWMEAGISAGQGILLSKRLVLDLGLGAAAASVHAGATDSGSARAGAVTRLVWNLGAHTALAVGPDVFAVLHRVNAAGDSDGHLSGLWVGLDLELRLTP